MARHTVHEQLQFIAEVHCLGPHTETEYYGFSLGMTDR